MSVDIRSINDHLLADEKAREDIARLTEDIKNVSEGFSPLDIIAGEYVDKETGEFISSKTWSRSDYIPCTGSVAILNVTRQSAYNAFYDADKGFVAAFATNVGDTVLAVPEGAVYFILSNANDDIVNIRIQNRMMLRIENAEVEISKLENGLDNIAQDIPKTNFDEFVMRSENLFDMTAATPGVYVNKNGIVMEDTTGVFALSDYIPVSAGLSYTKNNNEYAAYYDVGKNLLSANASPWTKLTPSIDGYVRINVRLASIGTTMLVQGDAIPDVYVPYGMYIDGSKVKSSDKPYTGKKIVTYGDSLVAGGGWQDYVAHETGAKVINMGIGGTTMTNRGQQQWLDVNGKYLAPSTDAQPEGGILCWDSISGHPVNAENTMDRIALIPSDTDIVLVEFGTNDLHQSKELGEWSDADNNTFRGAMKLCVERIRNRAPGAKIIFITPTVERTDYVNSLDLHKSSYVKAILESEIEINVPVINLWSKTSWSVATYPQYSTDDLHWNDAGKQIVGSIVAGYLMAEKTIVI